MARLTEAHPWVRRCATGNGLCVCSWRVAVRAAAFQGDRGEGRHASTARRWLGPEHRTAVLPLPPGPGAWTTIVTAMGMITGMMRIRAIGIAAPGRAPDD
jgi:hypothetical protein